MDSASTFAPVPRPEPTGGGTAMVVCAGVHKSYPTASGNGVVLDGVDLRLTEGEFVCLLGPSGCGKTTLLNCIAGFVSVDSGSIQVGGREVDGPGSDRGMVFQDHALFPWFTVRDNVETGPRLRGVDRRARREISQRYLSLVGLADKGDLYPSQLSGGMKQRVGIARALANSPRVLLMDEPFGALDAMTRQQMQRDLLDIWSAERKTVIFVTHDVQEAAYLADRIVVMAADPGRVREVVQVDQQRPRSRTSTESFEIYRLLEGLLHPVEEAEDRR